MRYLWLLLVLVLVPLASAIPEIPHQFYGTVSDDNGPVSGTLTAKLCGVDFSIEIIQGDYGLNKPFLVSREDCSETNIEFYVGDYKAGDYTYESGAFTELNFNVPVDEPESPPSGGGGSGGGGTPLCTENWECSAWGECVNQRQTRTCVDLNNCGIIDNRPELEQTCVIETSGGSSEDENENKGNFGAGGSGNEEESESLTTKGGITNVVGAVVGGKGSIKWIIIIGVSLVVVIELGVFYYKIRDDIGLALLRYKLRR